MTLQSTSINKKKGMISQPRYLPALNYLQRIYYSNIFVILDDVQHQRRCVEHRNKILMNGKPKWLTINIDKTKSSRPIIKDINIKDDFVDAHENAINLAYKQTKYFDENIFRSIYGSSEKNFVKYFIKTLRNTFKFLNLSLPEIFESSLLHDTNKGSEKILKLCSTCSIKEYISGTNGRDYLDSDSFESENIKLYFHDFKFPIYNQYHSKQFVPWLTWLDCYFNEGKEYVKNLITQNINLESK